MIGKRIKNKIKNFELLKKKEGKKLANMGVITLLLLSVLSTLFLPYASPAFTADEVVTDDFTGSNWNVTGNVVHNATGGYINVLSEYGVGLKEGHAWWYPQYHTSHPITNLTLQVNYTGGIDQTGSNLGSNEIFINITLTNETGTTTSSPQVMVHRADFDTTYNETYTWDVVDIYQYRYVNISFYVAANATTDNLAWVTVRWLKLSLDTNSTEYKYIENFEDDTVGQLPSEDWYILDTSESKGTYTFEVSDYNSATWTKTLMMDDTGANSVARANFNLTADGSTSVASADVEYVKMSVLQNESSTGSTDFMLQLRKFAGEWTTAVSVGFYNNKLFWHDGTNYIQTSTVITVGVWYNITVYLNYTTDEFRLVLDHGGTTDYDVWNPMMASFDGITTIRLEQSSGYNSAVCYVDNMEVGSNTQLYEGTPSNNPPVVTNPIPADSATDVSTSPTLSVSVSDADGDSVTVTFKNGADDSTIGTDTVTGGSGTASVTWSGLSTGTSYSWYVIADDGTDITTSAAYGFTTEFIGDGMFHISTTSDILSKYGLKYPVTYMFSLPADANNIAVSYRFGESENWHVLTEKQSKNATSPTEIYNGINSYRCDYANDTLILNIGFGDTTDIYIIVEEDGNNIVANCSFVDIPTYYDNRKCAVVITWDDWNNFHDEDFIEAGNIVQARNLWATVGVITHNCSDNTPLSSTVWQHIQNEVNEGCIEVASHSRTHPHIPYDDYDSEINGSRQDILNNLTLPYGQYVYAFLYPYGEEDSTSEGKCGDYHYLISRDTYFGSSTTDFSSWSDTYGKYAESKPDIRMGSDGTYSLSTLNSAFDSTYSSGGIYHVMSHPYDVDWESYGKAHYSYISNHTDVWYAGYGLLYLYHYIETQDVVSIQKEVLSNSPPTVSITSPSEGATVNGTVTITGAASDSDGTVQSVEVKIDSGSWQTATGTTSWSYSWDSTSVSDGSHTIYARSYDNNSTYSTEDSVTVTVDNILSNSDEIDAQNIPTDTTHYARVMTNFTDYQTIVLIGDTITRLKLHIAKYGSVTDDLNISIYNGYPWDKGTTDVRTTSISPSSIATWTGDWDDIPWFEWNFTDFTRHSSVYTIELNTSIPWNDDDSAIYLWQKNDVTSNPDPYPDGNYVYYTTQGGAGFVNVSNADMAFKVMSIISNHPPAISNPSPSDGATDVSVNLSSWSCNISDADGDTMNWTIQTSPNIGSNSGNNAPNGSISCPLSGLQYSTSYTVYVNVTDGTSWTNNTYTFTTAAEKYFTDSGTAEPMTFPDTDINATGWVIANGNYLVITNNNKTIDGSTTWIMVTPPVLSNDTLLEYLLPPGNITGWECYVKILEDDNIWHEVPNSICFNNVSGWLYINDSVWDYSFDVGDHMYIRWAFNASLTPDYAGVYSTYEGQPAAWNISDSPGYPSDYEYNLSVTLTGEEPPNVYPPAKPYAYTPSSGEIISEGEYSLMQCLVYDRDSTYLSVSFYWGNGTLIGVDTSVSGDYGIASIDFPDVQVNETYTWYAIVDDGTYTNRSDNWTFTVSMGGEPPLVYSPSPANGATNISLLPTLSVLVYDTDSDSISVTFYDSNNITIGIDTFVNQMLPSPGQASVQWNNVILSNHTYEWYAVADDGDGNVVRYPTTGYLNFTTGITYPPVVTFQVKDTSGFPLSGVNISCSNLNQQILQYATTNTGGFASFSFNYNDIGQTYDFVFKKANYTTVKKTYTIATGQYYITLQHKATPSGGNTTNPTDIATIFVNYAQDSLGSTGLAFLSIILVILAMLIASKQFNAGNTATLFIGASLFGLFIALGWIPFWLLLLPLVLVALMFGGKIRDIIFGKSTGGDES